MDLRYRDERLAELVEKVEELFCCVDLWEDDFQSFPVPVEVSEV